MLLHSSAAFGVVGAGWLDGLWMARSAMRD